MQFVTAIQYMDSPAGLLKITAGETGITAVSFCEHITENESPSFLTKQCAHQLLEYMEGSRKLFELPLQVQGTPFQQRVWDKLLTIPFGKTCTYHELAVALGDPKCIRAAGTANGRNPIAVIIPCHRVIGTHGELTGYAGGLPRKKWLLDHEARVSGTFSRLF
ncbi:MAG: methylated-DNA--[protein]-cysteine S-methyltransferase [Bacteroidia bacterium]|nr:methylated-DNA--[protein]-cysteine S-methyltransferase [Bacteroidia bacterium]